MEIYAAFASLADHHLGRIIDVLGDMKILDDTLICYIIGDNGASTEGTLTRFLTGAIMFTNWTKDWGTLESVARDSDRSRMFASIDVAIEELRLGRMIVALLFTLFSTCAWSQTQLSTVFGTINDLSGAVIPGAQVTIVNQSTGLKRAALTDMTGQYHLAGLQTGNYALRAEKEGFQTQAREGIALPS